MNCYYCHKELDAKTSKTIFIARFKDGQRIPNPCDAQPVCICEECLEKFGTQNLNMEIKKKCLCCGCEISGSAWSIQDFCDRCYPVVLQEVFDKNNDNLTVEKLRNKIKEKLKGVEN